MCYFIIAQIIATLDAIYVVTVTIGIVMEFTMASWTTLYPDHVSSFILVRKLLQEQGCGNGQKVDLGTPPE